MTTYTYHIQVQKNEGPLTKAVIVTEKTPHLWQAQEWLKEMREVYGDEDPAFRIVAHTQVTIEVAGSDFVCPLSDNRANEW